jgi:hypothetical protein
MADALFDSPDIPFDDSFTRYDGLAQQVIVDLFTWGPLEGPFLGGEPLEPRWGLTLIQES